MIAIFETTRDFLLQGGEVLVAIMLVTMLLWALILERFYYLKFVFPAFRKEIIDQWQARSDKDSWTAEKIRNYLIARTAAGLNNNISVIKVIVALCPLLGLLGTVTGMISVFDAMATAGTSNARLMASGISRATIPTMAGMVAALSGIYLGSVLERFAKREKEKLIDQLDFRV